MSSQGDSPITLPASSEGLAGVLSDARRRAIYQHVTTAHHPVTVNDVAERFAIHRNAAKHHLDKLLDAGLLRAEFKRVNGKKGPGAGRPSKLYTGTGVEVSFSVPERHYDLLAHLLLQALTQGADLDDVGRRFGAELAAGLAGELKAPDHAARAEAVLDRLGFAPKVETDEDGNIWVTTENCPFGSVALEAPGGEICRLDHAIVSGVLEQLGCPVADVREHASLRKGQDVCVREVTPA